MLARHHLSRGRHNFGLKGRCLPSIFNLSPEYQIFKTIRLGNVVDFESALWAIRPSKITMQANITSKSPPLEKIQPLVNLGTRRRRNRTPPATVFLLAFLFLKRFASALACPSRCSWALFVHRELSVLRMDHRFYAASKGRFPPPEVEKKTTDSNLPRPGLVQRKTK